MKNKMVVIIGILLVFVLSFILLNKKNDVVVSAQSNNEIIEKSNNNSSEVKEKKVKVDIKGAVKKPGVYEVNSDNRVIDVISLSGGLKSNANTNYINLSAKVTDEMVIWIYTISEINKLKLEKTSSEYMIKTCNCPVVDNTTCLNSNINTSNKESLAKLNINIASLDELTKLDGIGESKAKNIIEYRNKNGKFEKLEDIMNVTGIGNSAYNKIKDKITIN